MRIKIRPLSLLRYFIFLCLCAGLCLSAVSCRKYEKPRNEIEFWTLSLSPFFDDYIKNLITTFEQQNPGIKIKWTDIPYDAAHQKLLAAFASGSGPDVINLSTDFLAKFNRRGLFLDLKTVIPKDSLSRLYLPHALEDCTSGDKIIGVPWYLATYCVIYNKSLFGSAGFTSSDVPATFDDAIKFIKEYKDRTGKFAFFWNIGKDSYLPMMLGSEGIELLDSTLSKASLNSPEVIEKLGKWVDLYKKGYLPRECVTATGSAIVEPFQSGTVAFLFTGPVFLKRIKDNAPNIYAVTDVAPPLLGKNGTHELAAMSLSVSSATANPGLATQFALFVTNKINQLEFCKRATIYPSVTEALSDPFFIADTTTPETKARREGVMLLPKAKRLRSFLLHPQHDKLLQILEEAIQEACLTDVPLPEILDRANNEWNRLLVRK